MVVGLVTATSPSAAALGATCRLSGLIDMVSVGARNRVALKAHDRVGQMGTLIGLYPGLDTAPCSGENG